MPDSSKAPDSTGAPDLAAVISELFADTNDTWFERRPVRVETHVTEDMVVVVLEGALSSRERTLVHQGEQEAVVAARREFQHAMRGDFIQGVQTVLGRHVVGFFSDHQADPDLSIEVFLLEPVAPDGPS